MKTVVAFSAITGFHHSDTHFAKNLFTFWPFASRHISREKYILSELFLPVSVKHAFMRRAMWFPAAIELKKKNEEPKSR